MQREGEEGPGARERNARRSTEKVPLTAECEHPVVTQVPLVNAETQPVRFAPQYKTRYPFYRWVGWRYFSYRNFPPALGSEPVSSGL